MRAVRTSETLFEGLEGYDFPPRYLQVGAAGLRMHYVEAGDPDAAPVLMLHGNATWSYLYRRMIPVCAAAGHRVIAPDLIGFGRSDKLTRIGDDSYRVHVEWLTALIVGLDLRDITLFCHDWGSLLGLRVAAEHESRFARIVIGNGALPIANRHAPHRRLHTAGVLAARAYTAIGPDVPVSWIVNLGCRRTLTPGERHAYDVPFTAKGSLAGARAFPASPSTHSAEPRGSREPRGVGDARPLGEAVPHRLQRRRSDHPLLG